MSFLTLRIDAPGDRAAAMPNASMPPPSRVPCMDARRLARDDTIQKRSRAFDRRVEAACALIGKRCYYACAVLGKRGKLRDEFFSLQSMKAIEDVLSTKCRSRIQAVYAL